MLSMNQSEKSSRENNSLWARLRDWPVRIVQGALVGGGAILPGVSGGVLCVAFGIYRPMMELLSHPIKSFKKHYRLFIPFIIGWLLGFWGLARITELLFSVSSTAAVSLFAGLVAGTLPQLFSESSEGGVRKSSYIGMTVAAFLMFALLSSLKNGNAAAITPNIGWFVLCGVVWGLSLVVPGLSSSSILIFLGLYEPMASGIAELRPDIILPLIGGIIITVAASARLVDMLFQKYSQFTSLPCSAYDCLDAFDCPDLIRLGARLRLSARCFFARFVGGLFPQQASRDGTSKN